MKKDIIRLLTEVVIACLLFGCIIFLSSFANKDEEQPLIEQVDIQTFDSYIIDNPSVIFANNFGGSQEDILFDCFEIDNFFYLFINTNSSDKVFNCSQLSSVVLVVNENGNIEKQQTLKDQSIIDCLFFNNNFYVMYSQTILVVNTTLELLDTYKNSYTHFLKRPDTLINTTTGQVYQDETFLLDIKEFSLLEYINDTLFLYKDNNLYIYDKIHTTPSYVFEDLLYPTISFDDGFIISGVCDNQTTITKLTTTIDFSYMPDTDCQSQTFVMPYSYGYSVFQNISQGINQFMLCEHGDLTQQNTLSLFNTNKIINIFNHKVVGLTSAENLIVVDLDTATYKIINGDISPQRVWLLGDFLFINSSASCIDYSNNFGNTDVFMFKLA